MGWIFLLFLFYHNWLVDICIKRHEFALALSRECTWIHCLMRFVNLISIGVACRATFLRHRSGDTVNVGYLLHLSTVVVRIGSTHDGCCLNATSLVDALVVVKRHLLSRPHRKTLLFSTEAWLLLAHHGVLLHDGSTRASHLLYARHLMTRGSSSWTYIAFSRRVLCRTRVIDFVDTSGRYDRRILLRHVTGVLVCHFLRLFDKILLPQPFRSQLFDHLLLVYWNSVFGRVANTLLGGDILWVAHMIINCCQTGIKWGLAVVPNWWRIITLAMYVFR